VASSKQSSYFGGPFASSRRAYSEAVPGKFHVYGVKRGDLLAHTIEFRCSSIDIRFRRVRRLVCKRFACLVRTRTGCIFTGGAAASSSRIRDRFSLRTPFSADTPFFIIPNLCGCAKCWASALGAAMICVPRSLNVSQPTTASVSREFTWLLWAKMMRPDVLS
jgi:hypothetical protein